MRPARRPPRTLARATGLAVAFGVVGCLPDLGPCDPDVATAVVFLDTGIGASADNGLPMYAGQALAHISCGSGATCHADAADRVARYGAPYGLDFDADLACLDARCLASDRRTSERLGRGVDAWRSAATSALAEIDAGRMPPGAVGRLVVGSAAKAYFIEPADRPSISAGATRIADVGRAIPTVESAAGRELLRAWLACGAPVVERAQSGTPVEAGGPCGQLPDGPVGACITRLDVPVVPPDPEFGSIHGDYLAIACAPCHTSARALVAATGLDFSTPDRAYDSLVDAHAEGSACREGALTVRVVPFAPDASLLLDKLSPTPSCGTAMPTPRGAPASVRDAIRRWIAAGALR